VIIQKLVKATNGGCNQGRLTISSKGNS